MLTNDTEGDARNVTIETLNEPPLSARYNNFVAVVCQVQLVTMLEYAMRCLSSSTVLTVNKLRRIAVFVVRALPSPKAGWRVGVYISAFLENTEDSFHAMLS